ncbi:MAG: hypothetical protein E7255_10260 [Lachnospiraceae bacterium]|nr:hypothetical protein [Lachnospiraceae bacterium]
MKKSNIIQSMGNEKRSALRISFVLFVAFFLTFTTTTVSAASTYITVEEFAKELAKEIGLKPADGSEESVYVNALIEKSIIKPEDFSSYKTDLTRTEAAVLLNRADEYLYGDTLDPKFVELTLEKRISDIGSIEEDKRLDVVKCYLKGFIKGYSNGKYSTDRKFKGNSRMSYDGALKCIAMLKDKSLRAKISPDGQLIRTTKLPKNADKYPYILASYPNEYYDGWKFMFEGVTASTYDTETNQWKVRKLEHFKEWAYPFEVDKSTDIPNFAELKAKMLDVWVEKARTNLKMIFNADYRTIDEEWVETVLKTDYTYGYGKMEENTKKWIEKYVERMKKNKTIIESDQIAIDGSSLYYYDGCYHLRTYVRYRILSSETVYENKTPYDTNDILYSSGHPICFSDFELSEWKECCFDIILGNYEVGNLGVMYVVFVEPFYIG